MSPYLSLNLSVNYDCNENLNNLVTCQWHLDAITYIKPKVYFKQPAPPSTPTFGALIPCTVKKSFRSQDSLQITFTFDAIFWFVGMDLFQDDQILEASLFFANSTSIFQTIIKASETGIFCEKNLHLSGN